MTVYEERKDDLERYEFMWGKERGRLAISLDCITDALVLAGQHGVYCQSARQLGKPAMDIQLITKSLTDAKELITSVIEAQRARRAAISEPEDRAAPVSPSCAGSADEMKANQQVAKAPEEKG